MWEYMHLRPTEIVEYSITSQCNVLSSYHGGLHGAPRDWVLKGFCEKSGNWGRALGNGSFPLFICYLLVVIDALEWTLLPPCLLPLSPAFSLCNLQTFAPAPLPFFLFPCSCACLSCAFCVAASCPCKLYISPCWTLFSFQHPSCKITKITQPG